MPHEQLQFGNMKQDVEQALRLAQQRAEHGWEFGAPTAGHLIGRFGGFFEELLTIATN